jgi:hypothetical protein
MNAISGVTAAASSTAATRPPAGVAKSGTASFSALLEQTAAPGTVDRCRSSLDSATSHLALSPTSACMGGSDVCVLENDPGEERLGQRGRPERRNGRSRDIDAIDGCALRPDAVPSWPNQGQPAVLGASAAVQVRSLASLEDLFPAIIRRASWSGDGQRGTARIEIGDGVLAGATLLIHADGGRVRVLLDTPPGADVGSWRERITRRLAGHSVPVDEVEVS